MHRLRYTHTHAPLTLFIIYCGHCCATASRKCFYFWTSVCRREVNRKYDSLQRVHGQKPSSLRSRVIYTRHFYPCVYVVSTSGLSWEKKTKFKWLKICSVSSRMKVICVKNVQYHACTFFFYLTRFSFYYLGTYPIFTTALIFYHVIHGIRVWFSHFRTNVYYLLHTL